MKTQLLKISLINLLFLSIWLFNPYNKSKASVTTENKIQFAVAVNKTTVYVCSGKYVKKYHKTKTCRGLNNCKGSITSTTKYSAEKNNKTACLICYRY